MSGELLLNESPPLQDIDLLNRLDTYFEEIDHHLRAGHGWFIFNAADSRGSRIASFILARLTQIGPLFTYYFVPWRDFSLNAYMVEVELQATAQREQELEGRAKAEFDIASRVSRDSMVRMIASDLLIVTGLRPAHRHELIFLDETVERRHKQRLSTILITPRQPHDLAAEFTHVVPGEPFWDRLYARMYERSLIAV